MPIFWINQGSAESKTFTDDYSIGFYLGVYEVSSFNSFYVKRKTSNNFLSGILSFEFLKKLIDLKTKSYSLINGNVSYNLWYVYSSINSVMIYFANTLKTVKVAGSNFHLLCLIEI